MKLTKENVIPYAIIFDRVLLLYVVIKALNYIDLWITTK